MSGPSGPSGPSGWTDPERKRSFVKRRKAERRCLDCSSPATEGAIRCALCLDRRRVRQNTLRAELRAQGKCMRCRVPRGKGGTAIHCRPCADLASLMKWARENRLRASLEAHASA